MSCSAFRCTLPIHYKASCYVTSIVLLFYCMISTSRQALTLFNSFPFLVCTFMSSDSVLHNMTASAILLSRLHLCMSHFSDLSRRFNSSCQDIPPLPSNSQRLSVLLSSISLTSLSFSTNVFSVLNTSAQKLSESHYDTSDDTGKLIQVLHLNLEYYLHK